MTPDELNRKMEFVVEHQAKFSAHLDELAAHAGKFEKWSKNLLGQMSVDHQRMIELFEIQSRRLDRAEKEDRAAHKRHEDLLRELREGFDRILDRLSDKNN